MGGGGGGGCLQVRWIRALYSNFSEFTADQERLISLGSGGGRRFDYVEGFVVAAEGLINNWRSSFFSPQNPVKLTSLKHHSSVLYCLEVTKNYDDETAGSVDQVGTRTRSLAFQLLAV
jgi:cytokinin dehydrogenase